MADKSTINKTRLPFDEVVEAAHRRVLEHCHDERFTEALVILARENQYVRNAILDLYALPRKDSCAQ